MQEKFHIFHSVFSVNGKDNMFKNDDLIFVFTGLKQLFIQIGGNPIAIGGSNDHVHILFKVKDAYEPPKLILQLMEKSMVWINENFEFNNQFCWQRGQIGFSLPPALLDDFKMFVECQEIVHSVASFKDEMKDMLSILCFPIDNDSTFEFYDQ